MVYGTITDDTSGDIARIKNGTDKIDPDYCIRFDKTEIGGLNGLKGEFCPPFCTVAMANSMPMPTSMLWTRMP